MSIEDHVYIGTSKEYLERARLSESAKARVREALGEDEISDRNYLEIEGVLARHLYSHDTRKPEPRARDIYAEMRAVAAEAQSLADRLLNLRSEVRLNVEASLAFRVAYGACLYPQLIEYRHYNVLPPLLWELGSILACLAEGANQPTPRGRPRSSRENSLVFGLALVWNRVKGSWPARVVDPITSRDATPFQRLVDACVATLPAEYAPDSSLSGIVRKVCERNFYGEKGAQAKATKKGSK